VRYINKTYIRKVLKTGVLFASVFLFVSGCTDKKNAEKDMIAEYETSVYDASLYEGALFSEALCVSSKDVLREDCKVDEGLHAAALFDLEKKDVLYSTRIHEHLAPASTTKILTAYVALNYGNLDDKVIVSEKALDLEAGSSVCNLKVGDTLTLKDLLYGLMLRSGNDSAVAIAEHIGGSIDAFVDMMNEEAWKLGATNSHFMNPHGLHHEEHYTTAYDLYLMFNQCLKNETFVEIINTPSYQADIMQADGSVRSDTWKTSNAYLSEDVPMPEHVTVIGGKTGTTDQAGRCLILYNQNDSKKPFISIVMGAPDKTVLYQDMTALMASIPQ